MEKAAEKKPEGTAEPKKGMPVKTLLTVLFLVVNVVTVGGGAALVYMSTLGFKRTPITEESEAEKLAKAKEHKGEEDPIVYTMESFTVNLSGQPRRTIRATMSFELMDEKGFEELVQLGAQPRDEIGRLLNGKTFIDIESIQGKLTLKDQITTIVSRQLKTGMIRDIYFNEFVVQ
ncbi:MAG: flagellar basal body-associated protein FliL [Bdellovibrionales bacterium]